MDLDDKKTSRVETVLMKTAHPGIANIVTSLKSRISSQHYYTETSPTFYFIPHSVAAVLYVYIYIYISYTPYSREYMNVTCKYIQYSLGGYVHGHATDINI